MANEREENLKSHIRRVVGLAEPELLPNEVSRIADAIDSSLLAYSRQAKRVGSILDPGQSRRRGLINALVRDIKTALVDTKSAAMRESSASRAEQRLRLQIRELLAKVDLKLTGGEERKVEDRVIRLLDEYIRAPAGEKQTVYEIGVEAVLAALDPPAQSRGASAKGSAA